MDTDNSDMDDIPSMFQTDGYHPHIRSGASMIQPADSGSNDLSSLQTLLNAWNQNYRNAGYDPIPTLQKMSEILEKSVNDFLLQDPDPLDDRHPARTHPHMPYGNRLKLLCRNEDFMAKLVVSYLLTRENPPLVIAAARLLLNCVPGLDSSAAFSDPENLLPQLFQWAERGDSTILRAYAMGLLAAAMEAQETASKFREQNALLIPIALRRLAELKEEMLAKHAENNTIMNGHPAEANSSSAADDGPFANIDITADAKTIYKTENNEETAHERPEKRERSLSTSIRVRQPKTLHSSKEQSPPAKRRKIDETIMISELASFPASDDSVQSNSNWYHQLPLLIGKHQIFPLTLEMHQRLILQYLTPTGEYQDLLVKAYEGGALPLILEYLDLRKTRDVRLTFDATRYVASLLVHRKFAMEFVQMGGVEALLKIPNGCLAAIGVATCLYYLAYSDDVMETFLSQRPTSTIDRLVEYALWCVEHSHESGMASACMFFTHGIRFRPILERFDQKDGPRIILNYLTTLSLMVEYEGNELATLSDEQIHTSIQTIRNVAACIRSYMISHLYIKLEQLRKSGRSAFPHGYGCSYPSAILHDTPTFKPMLLDEEGLTLGVWAVACALRSDRITAWQPIEDLRSMEIARYMFHIVNQTPHVENIPIGSRHEMCRNAAEVLWLLATLPRTQVEYTERLKLKGHQGCSLLSHIVELCVNNISTGEVIFTALQIIQLIVCAPPLQETKTFPAWTPGKNNAAAERKAKNKLPPNANDFLERMWEAVRNANGIMILTNLIRHPPSTPSKDRARLIAIRALQGMARSPEVKQLLSKLPIIADNELQSYLREFVPSEGRSDYGRFCKEAKKLIEIVTGRPVRDPRDLTQERLLKQSIVASTRITYSEQEVMELIHGYFKKKGMERTAEQLALEANLFPGTSSSLSRRPKSLTQMPCRYGFFAQESVRPSLMIDASPASFIGGITSTPKILGSKESVSFATPNRPSNKRESRNFTKSRSLQRTVHQNDPKLSTLDDVITQYFRMQHSECPHPVSVCPPFSLRGTHRCPDVPERNAFSTHIVSNTKMASLRLTRDRSRISRGNERFVHSRFRAVKSFLEQDEMYTTASFSIDDEHIIVGMYTGDVHWLNVETSQEESHTQCHHSAITHIEPSQDGGLLLTSSAFMAPYSALWRLGESQEHVYDFEMEIYTEFANQRPDKIIGTGALKSNNETVATVFDTETGTSIVKLWMEGEGQRYRRNVAHFSPDDSCILHDGRLWDIRASARPLHTFDKLNSIVSGVFHPHGNEVIINSEVWDMRTYKLLCSVPALDQCDVKFTSTGSIMYGIKRTNNHEDSSFHDLFNSNFTTFDTISYQQVSNVNVRRPILSICLDHGDQHVAVVEKTSKSDVEELLNQESSAVKLYEIGKIRVPEEDIDEAEEDAEMEPEVEDGASDYSSDTFGSSNSSEDNDEEIEGDDDEDDDDDEDEDEDENDNGGADSGDEGENRDSMSSNDGIRWQLAADGEAMEEDNQEAPSGESEQENEDDHSSEGSSSGEENMDMLEAFIDDDDDESFEEEQDSRGQGSSSIVLNPHLRRARRRAASERDREPQQ